MRLIYFMMILIMFVFVSIVLSQSVSDLLAKANGKYDADNFQGNFDLLKEVEKRDPENIEVIWRLARAHFDFSDNTDEESVIEVNIYTGFEYAKRALEKDNTHPKSHKWYGILIGRVGEIEGTEQKIKNSYKVAEHTLIAIELDPEDGGNYHVMGRWHYTLADLSWIERKIASWVYATPPEASFEEARDYFKQAFEKTPDEIRNYLWLGKTLIELDDKEGAGEAFKQALNIPVTTESDRILQKEAGELLDDL
ncbi:MAG: tetratricopeptide repeat protein [Candidatus Marinimicrobia bacterium]|nr:tetratricopeptide repeat protein [Candidatus Neomarinimicrobiota bacterium]